GRLQSQTAARSICESGSDLSAVDRRNDSRSETRILPPHCPTAKELIRSGPLPASGRRCPCPTDCYFLSVCAAPPPPDIVRLEDVKRFTNFTTADAHAKVQSAHLFLSFVHEKGLERAPGVRFDTASIYAHLRSLHKSKEKDAARLATLHEIRRALG